MRRHHLLVAVALLDCLQEIFKAQTQSSSLWKPHRQTLTNQIREHKQFHFTTNFTMVTTLGLLHQLDIFIQKFFLRKCYAINTGHHWTSGIATPIGRTNSSHFNGFDWSRCQQVWAAAQIRVTALCICCYMAIFQFFDKLILIGLSSFSKECKCIGLGNFFAHDRFLFLS